MLSDNMMRKIAERLKAEEVERIIQDDPNTDSDDVPTHEITYTDIANSKLLSPKRLLKLIGRQAGF